MLASLKFKIINLYFDFHKSGSENCHLDLFSNILLNSIFGSAKCSADKKMLQYLVF